MRKLRFSVLGYGHWGPNYVRLLHQNPNTEIQVCIEPDLKRQAVLKTEWPQVQVLSEPGTLWQQVDLDAVIIATPAQTHFNLAFQALTAGKHVLCEKPLSLSVAEIETLSRLAQAKDLTLMVGHTFLFNSAIQYIQTHLPELGELYYIHTSRTNLGPVRQDVSAVADLAIHDFSILTALLKDLPLEISARGQSFLQPGLQDLAFITLQYPNKVLAHVHVSWLSPVKVRQMTIVGQKKMLTWNDLNPQEPIRIYDVGGLQEPYYQDFGHFQRLSQHGDIHIPSLDSQEPLKQVLAEFINSIQTGQVPLSNAEFAKGLTQMLNVTQASMDRGGEALKLDPGADPAA